MIRRITFVLLFIRSAGPRGVTQGHLSPDLFVEARDRARTLRLWP